MDIYVNVVDDYGMCAWYNHIDGQSYLYDAVELVDWNTDEFAGTAFKTVVAAKAAGKRAKSLAAFDGAIRPKVKYFTYLKGKAVEVKFTGDNKIKA